ncbi:hypothetical protein IEQ34_006027 [Dendrobium chrysotoxum]|uniref:Uncharacterized protein n=1 Tax=Dendrobium chrysotoxum TaxID=161865 RepID=A0AAV7HCY9_DENCH|nr:hypothetical protein IEQ34_006027 [Dendrobium chrysotoxum]
MGLEKFGYLQKGEFENFPIVRNHYRMHGHSIMECFILHQHLQKQKELVKESKGNDMVTTLPLVDTNPVRELNMAIESNLAVKGLEHGL